MQRIEKDRNLFQFDAQRTHLAAEGSNHLGFVQHIETQLHEPVHDLANFLLLHSKLHIWTLGDAPSRMIWIEVGCLAGNPLGLCVKPIFLAASG